MSVALTTTGLSIEAFQTILNSMADDLGNRLGLTAGRIANIKSDLQSTWGNQLRVWSEDEAAMQEVLLAVYNILSLEASGANLDKAVRLLGVERIPAIKSQVTGTLTGTPAYSVANGVRFQFDDSDGDLDDGTTWLVVEGPYTIGGGGTVTVTLEAEDDGALAPGASSDWTKLDSIPQITSYVSTAQPIVGNDTETDTELRERARIEAYSRAQGPLTAIEAGVSAVEGVTYVAAWDNPTDTTDADGIPARAINTVVEGGADADVAAAIVAKRPAGARLYGTDVTEIVSLGSGRQIEASFDRVATVAIHFRITLTTSTAEEPAPPGLTDTVEALVVAQAAAIFGVGDDIAPWKLEGVIYAQGYTGIDAAVVEVSDDGASWSTSKYVLTIRQRGSFSAANTTALEV